MLFKIKYLFCKNIHILIIYTFSILCMGQDKYRVKFQNPEKYKPTKVKSHLPHGKWRTVLPFPAVFIDRVQTT
jgi:hypothetical protein